MGHQRQGVKMLHWMSRHSTAFYSVILVSALALIAVHSGVISRAGYVRTEDAVLSSASVLLFCCVGIGLYLVREVARVTYAVLEIGVALLALILFAFRDEHTPFLRSIWKITVNDLNSTIVVLGAVYILVRGLDNLKQGIDQREKLKASVAAATSPNP
jgi:hypothetical protein